MIKLSNMSFGYSKNSLLFKDLDLELHVGHIYGLLGKNGAGKSTLLKNMTGLLFPRSGHCTVNGYRAADRLPGFLQEVFFIPEEIYLPGVTAHSYAESTGHFYPKFDENAFHKMMQEFDVPVNKPLNKLSFGQQKKVMIAFGLATNTSILIMDEPTNGLDIPSKVQFRKIIAAALTEDRCVIISTHQVRDLDSLIDTVVVVHEQKIVLHKSLDEIGAKIQFTTAAQANKSGILYQEENDFGINTISINPSEDYNKVDMEILFNALTNKSKTVTEILN